MNGTPTNYTVDLPAGLTQVLADGPNTYLYGVGRIGEEQAGGWQYHLGDALGSGRQLANPAAAVSLARSYEPFGDTLTSSGTGTTAFAFTGEQRDATGLTYLRARYLSTSAGRFLSRDVWEGDPNQPMSYNAWVYVYGNPTTRRDPSGMKEDYGCAELSGEEMAKCRLAVYEASRTHPWVRPPGLSWIPQSSLPLLSDIPRNSLEAQYHVPGYEDYFNFCGQLSLGAILGLDARSVVEDFHDWATTRSKVEDEYDIRGTTRSAWLAMYINERHGNTWQARTRDFANPTYSDLRDFVSSSAFRIPLVALTGRGWIDAAGTIDHWLVITGTVAEWKADDYSVFNWVRVFNPFSNATEYYRWRPFRSAWAIASNRNGFHFAAVDVSKRPQSTSSPGDLEGVE